jgi:pyruvate carboxylase
MHLRSFKKILVANRSEIAIRVFRACSELGIRTIGIYSKEDKGALHRYKADETYPLPESRDPLKAYLDIETIVQIAKRSGVDAIHPGYGFLSENADFARACADAGIAFIGPPPEVLDAMGDKTVARNRAEALGIPIVPGTKEPLESPETAVAWAEEVGYPVILKASFGGGGRGMRVAHDSKQLQEYFTAATREAAAAFGKGDIFLEKYLTKPKHIEVQILADTHGNTVHLFERDCSVQRRHQKVIEIAPSLSISDETRQNILKDAVHLAESVQYVNAGTVEFLVDGSGAYYFIEMNPRIQVEHTVTEMITGIDIVKSQIHIAEGRPLSDKLIQIPNQEAVTARGFAIQCRVTTEDPANSFTPDYGRITHYRSAAGFGIRLDAGTAFSGAIITPFYDSLIVKVTAWSLTFDDACNKLYRALSEFRIRGVKSNIPFLENVIRHNTFRNGQCTTTFIEENPSLFHFPQRADRATKILQFIGDTIVNGNPTVPPKSRPKQIRIPKLPPYEQDTPPMAGTRDKLKELGAEKFAQWVREEQRLLVTDTTLRDAHQSLLATRVRTFDMLGVADAIARDLPNLFSVEMWGGATFDVTMRFLYEDPWERLSTLRACIPNVLFQMLLRGSNAVGYTNYPDNVVKEFVRVAARNGIDVFRIFDSLNSTEAMIPAIDAVRNAGAIAEAAICYTSDIFDTSRPRYDLNYYVRMAKELEKAGATMIGIKDMAGLCRPYAARKLVETLKQEIGLPVHFHTHDTAGGQLASLLFACEAGVDVVDSAISSLSGLTSQPSIEALVAALQNQPRDTQLDFNALMRHADYWLVVREHYAPFESDLKSSSGDVYLHEIPGGQYSNLRPQAEAMGVGDRLAELKQMYATVNALLGDIVKVTPSSKVVGDLALYMLTHNLTPETLFEKGKELQFPESVVGLFAGDIGYPEGGFPTEIAEVVLKGRKPVEGRLGAQLPPVDFTEVKAELESKIGREASEEDILSYLMYPKVFTTFVSHRKKYSDVSTVPTPAFFYGMEPGEELTLQLERGKTLFIKFIARTEVDHLGMVTLLYELNGQPRQIKVVDNSAIASVNRRPKADPDNLHHIGAPMPGAVVEVRVKAGSTVEKDDILIAIEAMKVQLFVTAPRQAKVKEVLVKSGDRIDGGDLLVIFE